MFDKILLKDSIEFDGTITDLKERLRFKNNRDFLLEWVDESNFKFVSNFSFGTLLVNNGVPIEGIKGFAKLSEMKNGKTKVELITKVRIELYFFIAILSVLLVVGLFSEKPWPVWTFTFFPLPLLWFWWIYRIQEKGFFNKLKKYLNSELKNPFNKVNS